MSNPLVIPVGSDPDQSAFDSLAVALPSGVFSFSWVWRERLSAWYVTITDVSTGVALVTGARLSPGKQLFGARVAVIDFVGYLFVKGVDGYARNALFTGELRVLYVTSADLADLVPVADLVDTLTVAAAIPA